MMRGVVVKVGRGRTTGREMGAASQNAAGTEMRTRAKRGEGKRRRRWGGGTTRKKRRS